MIFRVIQYVKTKCQPVKPVLLGRWNLKRDEQSEYYSVLNANRDNCYNDNNISSKQYSLEELIVFSHVDSYPFVNKKRVNTSNIKRE